MGNYCIVLYCVMLKVIKYILFEYCIGYWWFIFWEKGKLNNFVFIWWLLIFFLFCNFLSLFIVINLIFILLILRKVFFFERFNFKSFIVEIVFWSILVLIYFFISFVIIFCRVLVMKGKSGLLFWKIVKKGWSCFVIDLKVVIFVGMSGFWIVFCMILNDFDVGLLYFLLVCIFWIYSMILF